MSRRRLARKGSKIPDSTLHRYASKELGFCRVAPTVAIVDGKPGVELESDTGWITKLEPSDGGRVRKFRAFIFTPNVSSSCRLRRITAEGHHPLRTSGFSSPHVIGAHRL